MDWLVRLGLNSTTHQLTTATAKKRLWGKAHSSEQQHSCQAVRYFGPILHWIIVSLKSGHSPQPYSRNGNWSWRETRRTKSIRRHSTKGYHRLCRSSFFSHWDTDRTSARVTEINTRQSQNTRWMEGVSKEIFDSSTRLVLVLLDRNSRRPLYLWMVQFPSCQVLIVSGSVRRLIRD